MSQPFASVLTLTEVSQKGFENAQLLKHNGYRPAQLAGLQDQFADRAVVLHAAGNSRAITAAIFESAVSAADVEAQINALV